MAGAWRVLLVEDSPINQEVGMAMLETLGCRVEVASNGEEALRLVESNRYDLIFMDCQMPEMDGWEATEKIREAEQERAHRTPIIAMTAYMMDEEIERCRTAGMDDHLAKPFNLRELSEMLNHWTDPGFKEDEPESGFAGSAAVPGAEDAVHPASLDPEVLSGLKSLLGEAADDIITTIIKMYLDDSPSLVHELSRSLEARNFEAAQKAAHTLKSSSANLGAGVLAELCKEAEVFARSQSFEGAGSLACRIEAEYRMVERALKEVLNRGG